jgi:beta-glucosidase
MFHQGSLEFPAAERERILGIAAQVPTIVDVFLDRPAILTEIAAGAAALVGSFGAADDALLDLVFGRFAPTGKLPFELPSSMDAVLRQLPDVPYDSDAPLFPFGHGLSY